MTFDSLTSYAGFRRRLVASFIDSIIFLILATALGFLLFGKDYFSGPNEEMIMQAIITEDYLTLLEEMSKESPGMIYDSIATHLLPAIITLWCWIKFMGTPGKLLTSCNVVDAKTGKPVTFLQAVLRYFGYFISLLTFGLGYLWIIWDKRKQGFHDKIAGTVVVIDGDDLSQYSLQQLAEQS